MQVQYSLDLVLAALVFVGFWQVYAAMKRIEVRLSHFENTFPGVSEEHNFCKKHRETYWSEDECPKCREESRIKSIHRKKMRLENLLESHYACSSNVCGYMGFDYEESKDEIPSIVFKKFCPKCGEGVWEIGEAERLRLKEQLNILGLFSSIYSASLELDIEEENERRRKLGKKLEKETTEEMIKEVDEYDFLDEKTKEEVKKRLEKQLHADEGEDLGEDG